jgi:hypothetical protein
MACHGPQRLHSKASTRRTPACATHDLCPTTQDRGRTIFTSEATNTRQTLDSAERSVDIQSHLWKDQGSKRQQ